MSNYTPIVENSQPLAHYNCNDTTGNIVDNVNALDFVGNSLITYQVDGALVGEIENKAIVLAGILETANTLDTSNFELEFSVEFWIKPNSSFVLTIGDGFRVSLNNSKEFVLKSHDSWNQRGNILQASDISDNFKFGVCTSLSGDGNVMAVGSHDRDSGKGGVYIYDLVGVDNWVQRGAILQGSGVSGNEFFGVALALSEDGNILAVGAYLDDLNGRVYTYDRDGINWNERNILSASDGATQDSFGISCSLSGNGGVLVVGAFTHETTGSDTGAVYTYDVSGNSWIERNILLASDASNTNYFGVDCSLSSDASVLTVGAQGHDGAGLNVGAVYTYDISGISWTQRNILFPDNAINNDTFGRCCALSGDANILIVGATGVGLGGAVYTYDRDGINWTQRGQTLISSDMAIGDLFGTTVSISNDANILVVGAQHHETTGTNTGAVYTYDIDSTELKLNSDNWNYITLKYSNQSLSIYNNGYPIYSENQVNQFELTSSVSIQGDATIDELAIFDRLLSEYEIQARYNNGVQFDKVESNIISTKPIAYFPMNDVNDTLQSISGNIKGVYHNSPLLNQTGKHNKAVLFDGINQYAEVYNPNKNRDIYFDNIVLEIKCEDHIGSNNFIDTSNSNHTISNGGDSRIVSFGGIGNSASFDGARDILTISDSDDFYFGVGDFTIEFYIFRNTMAFASYILAQTENGGATTDEWVITLTTGGNMYFYNSIGGGVWQTSFSNTISVDLHKWTHIALVSNSGNLQWYIDGVLDNELVGYIPTQNCPTPLTIGGPVNDVLPRDFNGYLSNLRVTKGIARYTKNFTPPIPVGLLKSKIPTVANSDPYYDKVLFLVDMNAISGEGGSDFTDSGPLHNRVLNLGTPTATSNIAKNGQSVYLDGINSCLFLKNDIKTDFSYNDFTLESWVNMDSSDLATPQPIISQWGSSISDIGYIFTLNAGQLYFSFYENVSDVYTTAVTSPWVPNNNTWHHVAVCRNGYDYTLFVDGVLLQSTTTLADFKFGVYEHRIGSKYHPSSPDYFTGYMDSVRVTAFARYSENFTPSNKPLPIGEGYIDWQYGVHKDKYWNNVSLMLNMNGYTNDTRFFDTSKYGHAIVSNATIETSTTVSKYGGASAYFNGAHTRLQVTDNDEVTLGTDNYTIEYWIRPTALNDIYGNVLDIGANNTTGSILFKRDNNATEYRPLCQIYQGGFIVVAQATTGIPLNAWTHLAWTREGDVYRLFVNGVIETEETHTIYDLTGVNCYMGANDTNSEKYAGYLDDVRITKGVARYNKDFQAPIRQMANEIGSLQHTVECWFNMTTANVYNTIFSKGTELENSLVIQDTVFSTGGNITYNMNSTNNLVISDIQIGIGTWNHIVVVLDLDSVVVYLNGIEIGRGLNIEYQTITDKSYYIASDELNVYPSNASISDFVIHDKALTGDEIFNRYVKFDNPIATNTTLYSDYIKTLGPIEYWKFDDLDTGFVANEISDNHFTFNGGISGLQQNSLIQAEPNGKSIKVNECNLTSNKKGIYGLPLTISATINLNAYNPTNTVWMLRGGEVTSGFRDVLYFGMHHASHAQPNEFYYWDQENAIVHYFGFTPTLDTTYNITLVLEPTTVRLYINGAFFNEVTGVVVTSDNGIINTIARNNVGDDNFTIDDLLVFKKALTANEIQNLYTASQLSFTEVQDYYDFIDNLAPMHYYKLNDNSVNITDSVGGLDGVLSGNTFDIDYPGFLPIDPNNRAIELGDQGIVNFSGSPTFSGDFTISFYVKLSTSDVTKRELIILNGMTIYYQSGTIQVLTGSQFNTSISVSESESANITITSNGSQFRCFKNGVYISQRTINHNIAGLIKFASDAYTSLFSLDEVMLFDRILSNDEILELYNRGQEISFGTELVDYNTLINSLAPIHYYKLDDFNTILIDSVGGDDATLAGNEYNLKHNSLISDISNKSIQLNDAHVTFPSIPLSTDYTISFVFKLLEEVNGSAYGMGLITSNAAILYIGSVGGELAFNDGAGSPVYTSLGYTVPVGVNVLITYVILANSIKLYIDGVLFSQTTVVTSNLTELVSFNLYNPNPVKKCILDEFMIFDRELNSSEIANMYQSSFQTLNKLQSYDDFIQYSKPTNYYPLNDLTTTVIDQTGSNGGVVAGNTFTRQYHSMLQSDTNNKSTLLTDGSITLDGTNTVNVKTISFLMNVKQFPSINHIAILTSPTTTLLELRNGRNNLSFYNGTTNAFSDFQFKENQPYHVVVNFLEDHVDFYIDGKLDSSDNIDTTGTIEIDKIGEDLGNLALDEVLVYSERNLSESEIFQLYNLATYDFESLTGYRIRGTTQIEGSYRPLDVRLYQHNTGGLLSAIVSDINGNYEFVGLIENLEYDLVFFEEGKYTTCQQVYMGVYPESYQY